MSRRSWVIVLVVMVAFVGLLVGGLILLGNLATSDSNSFKAITGIEPQNPVMVYETGWEDYRGWFRTQLSTRDVQRLAQHVGALKVDDRSRRDCAPDGVSHNDAPGWWLDEPQALGNCWTNRDPLGGGVSVHYHEASQTVTLYMFST